MGKSLGNHNDEHRNIKMGVPFKSTVQVLYVCLSLMSQLHARKLLGV